MRGTNATGLKLTAISNKELARNAQERRKAEAEWAVAKSKFKRKWRPPV